MWEGSPFALSWLPRAARHILGNNVRRQWGQIRNVYIHGS